MKKMSNHLELNNETTCDQILRFKLCQNRCRVFIRGPLSRARGNEFKIKLKNNPK